jgi:hypothetical protein
VHIEGIQPLHVLLDAVGVVLSHVLVREMTAEVSGEKRIIMRRFDNKNRAGCMNRTCR